MASALTPGTRDGWPPGSFAATLTGSELVDLEAAGRLRRLRTGATLFEEGEASNRVLLLFRGRVKVACVTSSGAELLLAIRGPGELLGELAAIDGEAHSASVTALETLEALFVAKGDFNRFLEEHPRVMLEMLRLLSGRLRDADRKRVEFGALDTVGRVARRLVELADKYGEPSMAGVRVTMPLTQLELAGWIGASREAVSKALRTLRSAGLIETQRRSVIVLDVESLRRSV